MTCSRAVAAALLAATTVSFAAKADTIVLNYEAPGVQNTTATFSVDGVETFNSDPAGLYSSISTTFGGNGAITGVYTPGTPGAAGTSVQINNADQYGGAGGAGQYIVAFGATPYTLTLTNDPTKNPNGINYFGYWLSALDAGNQVQFYNGSTLVGSLTPSDVLSQTGSCPASLYCGNPNPAFHGQDNGEPFAFINFYDTTGTFNKVVFFESPAVGGYESDNHTVGFYTKIGGVPEPSTWAMMGLGFAGLAFAGYRSSRRRLESFA